MHLKIQDGVQDDRQTPVFSSYVSLYYMQVSVVSRP